MFPMIVPIGLLVGFGLWEAFKPRKATEIQTLKGTTPTGVPVVTVIPVNPSPPTPLQANPSTYIAPPKQTNATTPILPLTTATVSNPDVLQFAPIVISPTGAQSASITSNQDVQSGLNTLGYASPRLVVDGVLGPKTQAAINSFAAAQGMPPQAGFTQSLKNAVSVALQKLASPNSDTANHPLVQTATIQSAAATIPIVTNKDIQHALNTLGANPPLVEDGKLGPKSVAAVRAFQLNHGLTTDGIAGPATKTALSVAMSKVSVAGEATGVDHYHFDAVGQKSTTITYGNDSKSGKSVLYGTKA